MKPLPFLATLAMLAACAESPTAPSTQSATPQAGTLRMARNPAGTGQPGASCGSPNALIQPNGFGTVGFTGATNVYAGSLGTPSLANGSPAAVSQYDVACYQISNK
jgi:hypothetical protein